MIWLALRFPALALELWRAQQCDPHAGRKVLGVWTAQGPSGSETLWQVNRAGWDLGLRPGMRKTTALAMVPDIQWGVRSELAEARQLLAIGQALLCLSPMVTLEGKDTVLLEVSSTLRLWGGQASVCARALGWAQSLGHRPRWAWGLTPRAAAALATCGRWGLAPEGEAAGGTDLPTEYGAEPAGADALDALPLSALPALLAHQNALHGMGLLTLGDLRRQPRAGLSRRIGTGCLMALDQVYGLRPDPRQALSAPDAYGATLECASPLHSAEAVMEGLKRLLPGLLACARAKQAHPLSVCLRLDHERRLYPQSPAPAQGDKEGDNEGSESLVLHVRRPSWDLSTHLRLWQERLAHRPWRAEIRALHLACDQWMPACDVPDDLFPGASHEAQALNELLDRLQARLGRDAVWQWQEVGDHRPERGQRKVLLDAALPLASLQTQPQSRHSPPSLRPGAQGLAIRPIWLIDPPQPLPEHRHRPCLDGQVLTVLCGPERLETGWWDDLPCARDYFVAQAPSGALVWLFKHRLGGSETGEGWHLQGRFG